MKSSITYYPSSDRPDSRRVRYVVVVVVVDEVGLLLFWRETGSDLDLPIGLLQLAQFGIGSVGLSGTRSGHSREGRVLAEPLRERIVRRDARSTELESIRRFPKLLWDSWKKLGFISIRESFKKRSKAKFLAKL